MGKNNGHEEKKEIGDKLLRCPFQRYRKKRRTLRMKDSLGKRKGETSGERARISLLCNLFIYLIFTALSRDVYINFQEF